MKANTVIQRPWVKARQQSHASRSHDPFYQTKEWKAIRAQQLAAFPLCAECASKGRTTAANVVDHITPRNQGGSDQPWNLWSLCSSCHNRKSGRESKRKK